MVAVESIGWFIALLVSIYMVFLTMGWGGLVRMFPEGYRWWMTPAQWGSLAVFAALVRFTPWH